MRIYLDYNATAPVAAEVADAVSAVLRDCPGNASSIHAFGQRAKAVLDGARSAVALLIGAEPSEIVFTSGGTEADNLAVRGVAEARTDGARPPIITTAIEHEAVLNTVKALGRRGWPVTLLPADTSGVVSVDALAHALEASGECPPALVSVMLVNNELGTVQPVKELAALARQHGAVVHTDAVQAVGRVPVDVRDLGVDLLSIAGHKFGAPKGVGALWVRQGLALQPQVVGGRQERGRRAGTENTPAIEGLRVAAGLAGRRLAAEAPRLTALRDRLERGILASVPGASVNGDPGARVPTTANISFDGVEGESLVIGLDLEGIAVSTGSACSSGTLDPSHVLRAMGLPPSRVESAIRFSLGPATTAAEIDRVLEVIPPLVARLRTRGGGRG
ncbi:MAG: aminotransferase class V-fold PLP-dependent enzyme [Vicinamibacterales bacterium]